MEYTVERDMFLLSTLNGKTKWTDYLTSHNTLPFEQIEPNLCRVSFFLCNY